MPSNIANLLRLTFGEIPDIRMDTPLTSLGFQPADAVVLAMLNRSHTGRQIADLRLSDHAFSNIETVGDLAAAVGGVNDEFGK